MRRSELSKGRKKSLQEKDGNLEDTEMKKKMLFGIYYSQIDNSKMEQGSPRQGVIGLKEEKNYFYTLRPSDDEG